MSVWLSAVEPMEKDCHQISPQVPFLSDRDAGGLHREIKKENYETADRSEEEEEYEEEEDEERGDVCKGGDAKGRLRICFDPELELPRLQEWFRQHPHPSRKQACSSSSRFQPQ